MRLEIHMYPLDTTTLSFSYRSLDKLSTDAAPPELWMHERIKNERMLAAVPRQIYETYQTVFLVSTDER